MKVIDTEIPAVKKIITRRFMDERGFFEETYNKSDFASVGIDLNFVQDNHSLSRKSGTIRGLHYQIPPFAQDKLIRVVKGSILDVAVDLRKGSPTFGRHVHVILSGKEPEQLLVPIGFAHAFCTLEPDTEVFYKVTNLYSSAHAKGILWRDPQLGISWPVKEDEATVSDADRKLPLFSDRNDFFKYTP